MASGVIKGERSHGAMLVNVDISSYKSASNQYTAPCDGYVYCSIAANKYLKISINSALTFSFGGKSFSDENSCFVQKGMKIYISSTNVTSPTIVFRGF